MKVGDIVKVKVGIFTDKVARVVAVEDNWVTVVVNGGRVSYHVRDLEKM